MALDTGPLAQAFERFDEPAAQEAFDRALSAVSIEALLRDLLIPYLHDLGERWEAGTASVAQEHFASNFLRGRLLGLARGWGQGGGPLAILACAPGELRPPAHRIPDWPCAHMAGESRSSGPTLRSAPWPTRPPSSSRGSSSSAPRPPRGSPASATKLGTLARSAPLALAGAGASKALAESVGGESLAEEPVTEADRVARSARPGLARR